MSEKFERYHSTQGWFAKNLEIHRSTRKNALQTICGKIAEVMGVGRVGIWFYTIDREAIYEELTFTKDGTESSGTIARRTDFPIYFENLNQQRVLVIKDARKDASFIEFLDKYTIPNNVYSLLDSPIYSDGEMLGVICCEDTSTVRDWDLMDIGFAANMADLVGRLIETEKRHTYEKELRHRINYLEHDLKRKLDDLNEAKLSLDLALESAQVGKWDWDLQHDKLSLNKTWYTKLGYEFNEIPQSMETFKASLHPEDAARVLEELDKHLKGNSLFYECRYRMITKSGEEQWTLDRGCIIYRDQDGKPLRMTGVNVNVTPIFKWEQSLITSEQQLKAMIQSLPTPVAMFDKNFRYIAFSTRWEQEWQMFSVTAEGQSVRDLFRTDWLQDMEEALKGKTVSRDDALIELSPGVEVWIRWLIQPWKDANQQIGGVVVMAENITRRKETEMQLTQASKLSALGEMAGGIAHEINNPLSIIKGYIDLLRRHSTRNSLTPDLLMQYIEKMDQTVGRISRIVNGMRRFSRESSMDEKVKYSLKKIIEETLDICQERINNNGTAVEVNSTVSTDSFINCRPVEVSQVILNLINNSYQATATYPHPWIRINLEEIGTKYRLSIMDCGEGISVAVRKKLFQPFFTTKDVGVGTGLGLSISRGIIEEHEGKLFYQEDAAHTTFVIELPKLAESEMNKTLNTPTA